MAYKDILDKRPNSSGLLTYNICYTSPFIRFGLYGTPLEPALFDVDCSQIGKPLSLSASGNGTSNNHSTYATAVSHNNNLPVTSTTSATTLNNNGSGAQPAMHTMPSLYDDQDFRDLISINSQEKTGIMPMNKKNEHLHSNKYVFGLLEVEPLHFVCHSTSDGTRVERMDAGKESILNCHASKFSTLISIF